MAIYMCIMYNSNQKVYRNAMSKCKNLQFTEFMADFISLLHRTLCNTPLFNFSKYNLGIIPWEVIGKILINYNLCIG